VAARFQLLPLFLGLRSTTPANRWETPPARAHGRCCGNIIFLFSLSHSPIFYRLLRFFPAFLAAIERHVICIGLSSATRPVPFFIILIIFCPLTFWLAFGTGHVGAAFIDRDRAPPGCNVQRPTRGSCAARQLGRAQHKRKTRN
jgi:hypothetical protein